LELDGIVTTIAAKKREEKSALDMIKALTNQIAQLESNLDVLQDEREVLQAGIDKRVAHLVCITLEPL
jgi:septal ring factor EnvC (AmiA/AmiB activator)